MILCVLVRIFWCQLQQAITVSNVTISSPPEMILMLATDSEGESDKTATLTAIRQCVEGTGAGCWMSNNGKPMIG